MTQNNCNSFFLFSVLLASWKTTWENSLRSSKHEATAQPSPLTMHLPISSSCFFQALAEARTCQGWMAWSQTFQTGCGLWGGANRTLRYLLVLFLGAQNPIQQPLPLKTPTPHQRTRVQPSVRGIIFSLVLTSKHLREKLFWKHFPDFEYSKIGPLSHYLFRGTKNLAGWEPYSLSHTYVLL